MKKYFEFRFYKGSYQNLRAYKFDYENCNYFITLVFFQFQIRVIFNFYPRKNNQELKTYGFHFSPSRVISGCWFW